VAAGEHMVPGPFHFVNGMLLMPSSSLAFCIEYTLYQVLTSSAFCTNFQVSKAAVNDWL
jgi:hypothetical protein